MGLLQGRVENDTFVVVDSFRLPVQGTETRVNAGEEANEYMIQYTEQNELTRFSNHLVIGWYHSHPGYGCWLSGIDVSTQALYQEHQDPFLAIVIDPLKTKESSRVEIGAFRTLPIGTENASPDRVDEFGVHSGKYYSLKIKYSETDDLEPIRQENWVQLLKHDSMTNTSQLLKSLPKGNKACICAHGMARQNFIKASSTLIKK